MADEGDRLEAIEWMLAWLLAETRAPGTLEGELDDVLPSAQYRLGPERSRLLPHYERVLRRAIELQKRTREG